KIPPTNQHAAKVAPSRRAGAAPLPSCRSRPLFRHAGLDPASIFSLTTAHKRWIAGQARNDWQP
ncbi:MAG: hypothetical protein Q9M13_05335, partial [Mariprofundales bacterium]|nr:hypothetical protein [Mariprofundales bacterium]